MRQNSKNKKEVLDIIEKYFRKKFRIPDDKDINQFTITGLTFKEYCEDMQNFYNLGGQNWAEQFMKSLDMTIFEADTKNLNKNSDTIIH